MYEVIPAADIHVVGLFFFSSSQGRKQMDSDANNSAHAKSQARKKPLIAGRLDNNKSHGPW